MEPAGAERDHHADALVIGGGIAGIVTALELLDGGQYVMLVDRDSPERFGGLARWAFGGMALIGTDEQRRYKIDDSPELALEDWIRFGELAPDDEWPRAWAECYVHESREWVYEWLKALGLKFMPAVNWVERGSSIKGNSVPRYHMLWGAGLELVETLIQRLRNHPERSRLTVLHGHRVTGLESANGAVVGARVADESTGREFSVRTPYTVVATGGVNGSVEQVRRHWPSSWPPAPQVILNGAHPFSDGGIHAAVAELGGRLTHLSDMWNYAAGIPHPHPHFEGHGLSLVPPKSVLWLTPDGDPVGPAPMVTGYDTREMCRQVAAHPYTWQVLNWKIAAKELAISGSEHNPRVVNHQLFRFLLDLLTGNDRLVRQMTAESAEFVTGATPAELADGMNRLTGNARIDADRLASRIAPRPPRGPARRLPRSRAAGLRYRHPAGPGTAQVAWRRPAHLHAAADRRCESGPAAGHPSALHQPQKPGRHPDRSAGQGPGSRRQAHGRALRGGGGGRFRRRRRLGQALAGGYVSQRLHPDGAEGRRGHVLGGRLAADCLNWQTGASAARRPPT